MDYRLIFLPKAERDLRRLERLPIYAALRTRILALADDPRPHGAKKLSVRQGWRIRVGDYRVVYDIEDVVRIVTI